jgi:hypothetical protein
MPAYVSSPFGQRTAIVAGVPAYSFGGYNDRTPPSRFEVLDVAITSNVATLTVQLLEGLIPVVGALISVEGTQTPTSGGAPNFNVTNVALTAVSINKTTGAGTVSFALTSSNISTTADSGEALVPQPETTDVCANGSGLQFAMFSVEGLPNNSRDVSWVIATPSAPSGFTANLQVADVDQDSEYTTIDTTTAVGFRIVTGVRANFIRINLSGVSGGSSPTIIGKILS